MQSALAFLRPVRFSGAEATAYGARAAERDRIALRIFALLIILVLCIRLISDWSLYPEATWISSSYRLGAIAVLLALIAGSFSRAIDRVFHLAAGTGTFLVAVLLALGNATAPTLFPLATAGIWVMVFLMGIFAFGKRLVLLEGAMAVTLPVIAWPLSQLRPDPLTATLPVGVLTTVMSLGLSYVLEQYWRRAFRRDQELAASYKALRRTHQELAAAYASLTQTQAELAKMERTAALGRLVANVAHRINTPLGAVVSLASHLDEAVAAFAVQVQQGTVRRSDLADFLALVREGNGIVLDNAQQMAGLMETFKQLVADAGGPPRRLEVHDLLDVLRSSLPAMPAPGVSLVVETPPPLAVTAQWQMMEMVLRELVRNAVQHGFPAGRSGTVTVRARGAGEGAVEIRVADDGQGIPPQHLEHVFDPFYTDGRIGRSYGLGLSIVHNAVTGPLGGTIAIDSREGQGTVVCLRLPGARGEPALAAEPAQARLSA